MAKKLNYEDRLEQQNGLKEDFDIGIREAFDTIVGELKEGAFPSGVRSRITDEDQPMRVNCESLLENMEAPNRIKPKWEAVKASGKTETPFLRAKLEEERTKADTSDKPSFQKDRGNQRGEVR